MAWLDGHDVSLDAPANQGEVSQDVSCLVPDELVWPAKLATYKPILGQDESGFNRGTKRQAASTKRVGLSQKAEGTRLRQFPAKAGGCDIV
jgi:hypothetical protein